MLTSFDLGGFDIRRMCETESGTCESLRHEFPRRRTQRECGEVETRGESSEKGRRRRCFETNEDGSNGCHSTVKTLPYL